MKATDTVLTQEERSILILGATRPNGKYLNNDEIGQRLGIPVNRVKALIHQACVKLGAHNKNEAILLALIRGDIILTDVWLLDDLAEHLSSLGPDTLRSIANIVNKGPKHKRLPRKVKQTIPMYRRRGGILTNRERDVLSLVGLSLTNKEIADKLYISVSSVKVFLNRACQKLGASKRSDAYVFAAKQREINVGDVISFDQLIRVLAPLGADYIEKMAQLMDNKLRLEGISDVLVK